MTPLASFVGEFYHNYGGYDTSSYESKVVVAPTESAPEEFVDVFDALLSNSTTSKTKRTFDGTVFESFEELLDTHPEYVALCHGYPGTSFRQPDDMELFARMSMRHPNSLKRLNIVAEHGDHFLEFIPGIGHTVWSRSYYNHAHIIVKQSLNDSASKIDYEVFVVVTGDVMHTYRVEKTAQNIAAAGEASKHFCEFLGADIYP